MALTQFNEWEPRLDPVNGVMQQEPRVFAHDAVPVVIGAINNSDANHGLNMTSGGTGYAINERITLTTPTGFGAVVGNRAVVIVTGISGGGATGPVTNYDFVSIAAGTPGALYLVGDTADQVLSSGGGTGFTSIVTNTDIPNTQKRGCCLYVGNSGAVDVVMESGNDAIFNGVATGSFLPILVKNFVLTNGANNTTATNILALY
tara:strand:+ start:87 stop:698 length:612 start_codon:yes stop_codon:yes gene_type:complete